MIYYQNGMGTLHQGDAMAVLRELPTESVHTVVTSPPYWGLRDYGADGQLGLEATPEEYIARMVAVFAEVRRVLRKDGTLWLNMGDGYASGSGGKHGKSTVTGGQAVFAEQRRAQIPGGLKPKDLIGMPWRLAFALQADGWYLRQDIIWSKPNPMPESVSDRCTKAHEYIFLLSKSPRYYFDAAAIKEPATGMLPGNKSCAAADLYAAGDEHHRTKSGLVAYAERVRGSKGAFGPEQSARRDKIPSGWDTGEGTHGTFHREGRAKGNSKTFRGGGAYTSGQSFNNDTQAQRQSTGNTPNPTGLRNKRDVWMVATGACKEAHFATFPPALITPCILAGAPIDGVVLDPFMGSGTVARVAEAMGRRWVGIEIRDEYCEMTMQSIQKPLLDMLEGMDQ